MAKVLKQINSKVDMRQIQLYIVLIIVSITLFSCGRGNLAIDWDSGIIRSGNDTIKLYGCPSEDALLKYFKNDTSQAAYDNNEAAFTYIFNDMMKLSVFVPDSGAYDCFIYEDVDNKKQLSYFKLDDVIKYNYMPPYDSLAYDLGIRFKDDRNNCEKWSSKYEEVPQIRMASREYQKLVSTCDDIQDISGFYNNSLFFKDRSVSKEVKEKVLTKLIEITQVQLVGTYLRTVSPRQKEIVLGFVSVKSLDYEILKFKSLVRKTDFYILYGGFKEYSFNDFSADIKEQLTYRKSIYAKTQYLDRIQEQNLLFLESRQEEIRSRMDSCNLFICVNYLYSDTRLFFFKIGFNESGEISITKDYYNKEFLPTTRMTNYYLYW